MLAEEISVKTMPLVVAAAVALACLAAAPLSSAASRTPRLIYTGQTKTPFFDLFRINLDGSGVLDLTRTSGFDEEWPDASPDGSKIVFRGGSLRPSSDEIYVAKSDGSGVRQLTFNDAFDEAPVWSPDGRQVLFGSNLNDPNHECSFPPCNWDLYRVNADGTGLTRLTSSANGEVFGSYSPDGTTIVFASYPPTGQAAIWTMPAAGGGTPVKLTPDSLDASEPEYSPDGSKIAFIDNTDCSCASHIWVMNADGSGRKQLTFGDAHNDLTPAWSRDGGKIAISRTDGATGDEDVWVMKANGTRLTDVTSAPGAQAEPDWLP
jgi:Tol biopolymer transport system component